MLAESVEVAREPPPEMIAERPLYSYRMPSATAGAPFFAEGRRRSVVSVWFDPERLLPSLPVIMLLPPLLSSHS